MTTYNSPVAPHTFAYGFHRQGWWGWLIGSAFFFGEIGAGLFLVSLLTGQALGMLIGYLVVVVGKNLAHLMYLGRPDRFWRRTDQTFLEDFFPDWHGLPYIFNTLQYVWFNLPALWVWERIKVIHYQYEKPWEADHPRRQLLAPVIEVWRHIYEHGVLPERLTPPQETLNERAD